MAKDLRGLDIKVGDKIFVNGMQAEVIDLSEGGLIGANTPLRKQVQGMVLPGKLTVKLDFSFEVGKPVGCYILKPDPSDK